ncbi:ABC transporter ATP-binding protein, partial [Treponema sp. OttesenSCG-928-L16]|nr:ABC transporter ATP-binding protein [Treponema sp. OttesenSCG-928-L16]
LSYRGIDKIFDQGSKNAVHALKNVSFDINPGELFCLLGPSGCGKTTLLRITAGLESITGGKIFYGEKDVTTIPPFRRNIGMVFQSFALYPHMNVYENVAYGLRVRKTPEADVKRKVTDIMKLVGLEDVLKRNPSPTALSGGQQQRVAIARALVYDPDILLLDEPLANLDAKLRRYMRAEIRRIQKATNITTIFVTHDQEEAMAVGDRLAVLRDGIVEQIGSSDELYNFPQNSFVANFIGKMNFFNGVIKESGSASTDITLTGGLGLSLPNANVRLGHEAGEGESVAVAARPEHLSITKDENAGGIEGEVTIIQHLGHIVRYEVEIPKDISGVTLEVDMDGKVPGIDEHDTVKVLIDAGKAALYDRKGER